MLFLLLASTVYSQCISLSQSKHCTEFKDFSIKTDSLNGILTTANFDGFIDSNAGFNMGTTACPQWATASGAPLKFGISFTCAAAVYLSPSCNTGKVAPSLCKSSINLLVADVDAKIKQNCPTQSFTTFFSQYSEFVSSAKDVGCFQGFGSDAAKKCGLDSAAAATYCQSNPTALCCTAPSNEIKDTISADPVTSVSQAQASPLPETATEESTESSTESSSTESSDSSKESSTLDPLVIGGAAGGMLLLGLAIAAYFIMRKPKNSNPENQRDMKDDRFAPTSAPYEQNAPQIMEAVYDYQANLVDELTLNVSDKIEILEEYDDGWGMGYNITRGTQGVFPLNCLDGFAPEMDHRDSQFTQSSYATSKRISSLYADNTTIGRRSRYQDF